ncbi:L-threonylcarbamoyladenylate synthase [Dechloromonas sp. ZS-1]|uniref:L-threonylcarbamoyladenylate synthase n=1 Tax=Dechloromonas sp. ZS-1 TaxID=3138067 RepID=UPI0031FCCAF6
MARVVNIHPESPQPRLLTQAVDFIRQGAIVALPTDSCYALACGLGDKDALDRIRLIRGIDDRHHLTLMCRDLSEIANYARVDNAQYRLLKAATPGSYTFILEGSKELPRRVMHPKRKTIGLRIPDHPVALALLEELGEPLLTTTLQLPGDETPLTEGWEIQDRLDDHIDWILDAGYCGTEPTTVVDLTGPAPELVRAGRGPLALFGFEA